ncbi:preprotein translocase subunit SecE [Kibdelosporangium phytohabitans]|uniref:preprotein translocase subunit SecE n=1 Tax=Kibdelosporangium phytohabitans TaxID=860235 RepID=UPI0009FB0902|nr:preprotein translocase subunit SecE [Kibdelosporangium phytohabitans]MBE1467113.1 preprotein translocase subunit SecE [Kibdelosporangium phytohabitans]
MSEEPGKDREEDKKPQSRPVTAAARRERRASARPAARKDAAPAAKAKPKSKPADGEALTEGKKGRATPSRDGKEKRAGVFARLFRFLKEVVAELRKVIWPTRKQMITYTAVVLVFLAVMVAIIAGLDLGIGKGVQSIFG